MGSLGRLVVGDLYWRAGWATAESSTARHGRCTRGDLRMQREAGSGVAPGDTWWAVAGQGDWMVWLPGAKVVPTRTRDGD
jgi:hypothetical protein